VLWYAEVPSTNDVAARLAASGEPEGTVVAADAQSAGRGRLGRAWASPPGAGLYTSLILRPARSAMSLVTLAAGVAIAEGIEAACGLHAGLKWPNDVCVGRKKLAGILAEAGSSGPAGQYIVLGFGINLAPAAYPADVARRATSIGAELGREPDRGLVLAECLAAMATRYRDLQAGRSDAIVAAWRGRAAATFAQQVEWDTPDGLRSGVAEGVDETGALLVRREGGVERVISGEVRWRW
jgi:BirA family biotin operon repressor/biotin-[acetyl-CoA-carboxylase] ligase